MEAMTNKYLVNILGVCGCVGTVVYALSVGYVLPIVGVVV